MNKGIKIVTIGGGSSYTPELMEGFIKRYEELPIREIWLVDIEEGKEKLEIVGEMAKRMWERSGYPVEVHLTLDRRAALKDADFVTTQFRVGRLNARIKDERIPFSYGMLGQETNGAGGILKAFRTIPVILDIVEDMKELCPDAWLVNFTNPSGMITETVIKYGNWKKCIGLCNVPVDSLMEEPVMFDKTADDFVYQFAGLNHFHYHKVTDQHGNDVTSDIIEKIYAGADSGKPANLYELDFVREQIERMHLIPCAYHEYYYITDETLNIGLKEYKNNQCRSQQVMEIETKLFELYKNPDLDVKPALLEERGGAYYSDAACECISAIYNNKKEMMVVSTQNNGAIPCLPSDSIVEVSSYITGNGAQPVAWGEFESPERGWLQVMKAMEECVLDAAVHGDYGMALQAFMLNPLILSGYQAQKLLDEMLVANEKHLPQFASKIAELKEAGVYPSDATVAEILKKECC